MSWLLLVFLLFHCNILLLVVEMFRGVVGLGQQCDQAEEVAEIDATGGSASIVTLERHSG